MTEDIYEEDYDDIYNEEILDDLMEDDEISVEEAAFMRGYDEDV